MTSKRCVTIDFIKKFKQLDCLWNVYDDNYKNKYARLHAFEQLLKILKRSDPNANIDTVKKRVASLRNCYHKELNKVKASVESGGDVHIPKLWYYNLLHFLSDKSYEKTEPNDEEFLDYETLTDPQEIEMVTVMDQSSSSPFKNSVYLSVPQTPQTPQNFNRSSKRIKNRTSDVLLNVPHHLDVSTSASKPAFSAFGEHIAEKLRGMDKDAAKYCQKIINDAIFEAEFNNLNHTSRVVTDRAEQQMPTIQIQLTNKTPERTPSPSTPNT